ncbi:MAG: M81 family metallopeptidase [Pseudomonadota bacterium]
MPRIAVAGFQHETNTFAPMQAQWADFEAADSWPGLLTRAAVVAETRGMNLPIAGFVAAAEAEGVDLAPLLWCAAEPAAHVEDAVFERVLGMMLEGLATAGPVDGLYLDLHGAMVTESHEDGEGALLARLREALGPDLPIVASLDLHANVTPAMVALTDALLIFRTYPHLDMAETGARCLTFLLDAAAGRRPAKTFRQLPFLVPLPAQYTGAEPCRGLYAAAMAEASEGATAEIALGFTAADIPDCGPAILAYAPVAEKAEAMADRILTRFLAAEPAFGTGMLSPVEAVRQAMAISAERPGRPVVIADVQDNPGAGATSDTTGLLRALVEAGAQGAMLALLDDAAIATRAHQAGVGAILEGALGGHSGADGDAPFHGRFLVERLGDGRCVFTGEMYGGSVAVLGPTAVLQVIDTPAEIRIVVGSRRSQCLDRALFTHIGLDPRAARIIVVKSTVHFRADFEPIAETVLTAAAPGVFPCRLDRIPYRRLREGLRLGPGGPPFVRPVD